MCLNLANDFSSAFLAELGEMLIVLHIPLLNLLLLIGFLDYVTSTLFLLLLLSNWGKMLLFLLFNEDYVL